MRRFLCLHRFDGWARLGAGANFLMIRKVFTYKGMAWLSAALIMISGEATMASSLRLEDPSVFAGQWQAILTAPDDAPEAQALQDKPSNTCLIDLEPNQTLGKGAECLGHGSSKRQSAGFLIRTACRLPARKVQESSSSADNVMGFI